MKKVLFPILALVLALGLAVPVVAPAAAAMPNADYHLHGGNIYPTGGTIAEAVAAPDDGKFVQMDVGSWIILRFPGHNAAVPDGTAAADLRVDTFDAIYQADAEIFVSLDGSTWTSMGVHADTANIDLDLNGTGPVKYVKVDQNAHYIDPAYPTLGFDLDAVVALTTGILPYGEITSPSSGEVVFGSADFEALYYDDDFDPVYWAVRRGTCAPATNTVLGNVDGHTDPYSWDGYSFQATADTSGWTPDWYCFVFNPREDSGEQDIRLTRQFWVGSLGDLEPPVDYNPVGTDHTVSVSIGIPVTGVEVMFEVTGNNTASGSATTDEDGVASFTYSGANAGMDTITAYIDQNDNDTYDVSEPSTTATKYWLEHYVTGGGLIDTGKSKDAAKITFGGNVGFDLGGNMVGQWQVNFHNVIGESLDKGHFHSTEIIYIDFVDFPALPDPSPPEADVNYVRFDALGKFNGQDGWRIRVNATDFGEGINTEPDEIRIRLWNGSNLVYDSYLGGGGDFPDESYHVRTDLDGGNLQIHPPDLP